MRTIRVLADLVEAKRVVDPVVIPVRLELEELVGRERNDRRVFRQEGGPIGKLHLGAAVRGVEHAQWHRAGVETGLHTLVDDRPAGEGLVVLLARLLRCRRRGCCGLLVLGAAPEEDADHEVEKHDE